MVDIKCLVCEKSLKIPPDIDPADYDGQLFCRKCNLLFDVKLKLSKLRKYKVAKKQPEVKTDINIVYSPVPRPDYSKEAEGEVKELKES